eukprot:3921953-Prymnesium_polylepis.2
MQESCRAAVRHPALIRRLLELVQFAPPVHVLIEVDRAIIIVIGLLHEALTAVVRVEVVEGDVTKLAVVELGRVQGAGTISVELIEQHTTLPEVVRIKRADVTATRQVAHWHSRLVELIDERECVGHTKRRQVLISQVGLYA